MPTRHDNFRDVLLSADLTSVYAHKGRGRYDAESWDVLHIVVVPRAPLIDAELSPIQSAAFSPAKQRLSPGEA